MGIVGGSIGYKLLRSISSDGETGYLDGSAYKNRSKTEVLFGKGIWDELAGKVVIDFGCGTGAETVEVARHGAARVIGLDIRGRVLDQARVTARKASVAESPFEFATFEAVPIRKMRPFSNFLTREFLTSMVRCRLVRKPGSNAKAE